MIRSGRYRWMPKLPFVLGNEMAGRVEAVGAGVSRLKRWAAGCSSPATRSATSGGLYAEYAAVPEDARMAAAGQHRSRMRRQR